MSPWLRTGGMILWRGCARCVRGTRRWFTSGAYVPSLFGLALGVLAGSAGRFVLLAPTYRERLVMARSELLPVFPPHTTPPVVATLVAAALLVAVVALAGTFLGFMRKGWTLALIRKGCGGAYLLLGLYAYAVLSLTGQIAEHDITVGHAKPDAVTVFFWRYDWLWPAACIAALFALLHLLSWRRRTINLYTRSDDQTPAVGDRIVENFRTNGRDPGFRRSWQQSLTTHIMIIVILPILLRLFGCVDPYRPPYGGGKPAVATLVKFVKPEKKKRKTYILSPDAPIFFRLPELDDSKVFEEVEELTKVRYAADPNAAHGVLGDGDATTPGWADGFKDGIVRFIRLEYDGADWNDGMDSLSRADMNFLDEFRRMSGGMKTARHSESHPVRLLAKYPKGQAPPFVYMTGEAAIRVSKRDIKILREYLLGGGMLFADCGSPQWDRSFKSFAGSLFPGNPLLVIADDDPLFRLPFSFPNGAPPLWHHGGTRALGIKHKGRWVVFYHPGDINDAWKTGHSGMAPELARGAFQMGVNLLYYSFIHYIAETRQYRK